MFLTWSCLCVVSSVMIGKYHAQAMLEVSGFDEAVNYCKNQHSMLMDYAGIPYPVYQKDTWINIDRYTSTSTCSNDCIPLWINIEQRIIDKPSRSICKDAYNRIYASTSNCSPASVTSRNLNELLSRIRLRENVAYVIKDFSPSEDYERVCGFRQSNSTFTFIDCSLEKQFQCVKEGLVSPFTVLFLSSRTQSPKKRNSAPLNINESSPVSSMGTSSCVVVSSSLGGVLVVVVITMTVALIISRNQLHKMKSSYLDVVHRLHEDEHGYAVPAYQSNINHDHNAYINQRNSSGHTPSTEGIHHYTLSNGRTRSHVDKDGYLVPTPSTLGSHHYTFPTGCTRPQIEKDGNLVPTPSQTGDGVNDVPGETLHSTISNGHTTSIGGTNADYIHLVENEIYYNEL